MNFRRVGCVAVVVGATGVLSYFLLSRLAVWYELNAIGAANVAELGKDFGLGILLLGVALLSGFISVLTGTLAWMKLGKWARK